MKTLLVYIVKETANDTFVVLEGTVNKDIFKSNSGVKLNTKHLSKSELLTENRIKALQTAESNNFYAMAQ